MSQKFVIKQHDLLPHLQIQLLSGTDPVDLLNATSVTFLMSNRKTGLKISSPMVIADQSDPDQLGIVTYRWQLGDTDIAGDYNAEIQVNWPASSPQTFPAHSYMTISVEKDLGG